MGTVELHSEDESDQDTRATLPYIETIPCPPDSSGHADPAVAVLVETAPPPADLEIPYRLTDLAEAYFSKREHALDDDGNV